MPNHKKKKKLRTLRANHLAPPGGSRTKQRSHGRNSRKQLSPNTTNHRTVKKIVDPKALSQLPTTTVEHTRRTPVSIRRTPHHPASSLESTNNPISQESDMAVAPQELSNHEKPPAECDTDGMSVGADELEAASETISHWDLSASWDHMTKDAEMEWFRATQAMHYLGEALEDPDGVAAARYYYHKMRNYLQGYRENNKDAADIMLRSVDEDVDDGTLSAREEPSRLSTTETSVFPPIPLSPSPSYIEDMGMRGVECDIQEPWRPAEHTNLQEYREERPTTNEEIVFLISELKAVAEIRSTNTRIKIISKRLTRILSNQLNSNNGQRAVSTPSVNEAIREHEALMAELLGECDNSRAITSGTSTYNNVYKLCLDLADHWNVVSDSIGIPQTRPSPCPVTSSPPPLGRRNPTAPSPANAEVTIVRPRNTPA